MYLFIQSRINCFKVIPSVFSLPVFVGSECFCLCLVYLSMAGSNYHFSLKNFTITSSQSITPILLRVVEKNCTSVLDDNLQQIRLTGSKFLEIPLNPVIFVFFLIIVKLQQPEFGSCQVLMGYHIFFSCSYLVACICGTLRRQRQLLVEIQRSILPCEAAKHSVNWLIKAIQCWTVGGGGVGVLISLLPFLHKCKWSRLKITHLFQVRWAEGATPRRCCRFKNTNKVAQQPGGVFVPLMIDSGAVKSILLAVWSSLAVSNRSAANSAEIILHDFVSLLLQLHIKSCKKEKPSN